MDALVFLAEPLRLLDLRPLLLGLALTDKILLSQFSELPKALKKVSAWSIDSPGSSTPQLFTTGQAFVASYGYASPNIVLNCIY